MVKLPENHTTRNQSHVDRYDYEFRQQNSGFGQHGFERNDFWVTYHRILIFYSVTLQEPVE